MADNWSILDLTNLEGEMCFDKTKRRLVVVNRIDGELRDLALSDVNIIFIGLKVSFSSSIMYHFAKTDTVVIFCDWKGQPVSGVYPWLDTHGRITARQRAQASLSVPRAKNAWMRVIKSKIKGQANNLSYFHRDNAEKMIQLSYQVKSGDPDNKEAQAARVYWSSLFLDGDFKRIAGSNASAINSLMDYGYTVLRGHSVRATLSAGLAPTLGIFHKGRSNFFALADDLIEPFRPAIDYAVLQIGEDANIEDKEIRRALIEASLQVFTKDGRTIPAVMTDLAQSYGRYVEGEIEALEVPVWNPQIIAKRELANEKV